VSNWQLHIKCTQTMQAHPDWTDEQVLDYLRMHPLEMDIVKMARREVTGAVLPSEVSSEKSF
jgi:hypothetical protein